MDKANHLMTTLDQARAARDMAGAVDYLLGRTEVTGDSIGVLGFCMGGMLALVLAAQEGDKVAVVVPWYGAPLGDDAPDLSGLTAHVRGHFAENDAFFTADAVNALESKLKGMGKDVEFVFHEGTGHAFGNEENGLGTYDAKAKADAWADSVAFLKSHLSS
jgi:carboxymethylenebutenolidase